MNASPPLLAVGLVLLALPLSIAGLGAWLATRRFRQRRRRLVGFVHDSAAAVCAVDNGGGITATSPALLSLFGRHHDTLDSLLPAAIAAWLANPQQQESLSPPAWLQRPDGSRRQIRCAEYGDARSRSPHWRLLYVHDVTQAEAALEQNRHWRIALQGARLGLIHIDPVARELAATAEALYAMLGLGPDWCRASFERWLERVHPDDRAPLQELFSLPDLQRGRIGLEYRFRHADGHWEWLEQRNQFIDDEPRHNTILGLCTIITARKLAEQEIHRREYEFRMLAENSVDIIARYDLELRCQYINRTITHYLPVPRDAHIGQRALEQGWNAASAERFEQSCRNVIRELRPESQELELDIGSQRHIFQARLFPEVDGNGKLASLLCLCREITDLRQSTQLLEEENAVLEMIAGNRPLSDIVEQICLMMETQLPGALCSVMVRESDALTLVAAPSLPHTLRKILNRIEIAQDNGSCGSAAFSKQAVIAEDIQLHPAWAAWRDEARTYALRACWSFPILNSEHDLLGTFAVYFHDVARPGSDAIRLIHRCSHIAAIAMQRDRHESQLYVLATQDCMTGLSNRRHFLEMAELELRHARRYRRPLAVLMLDLDRFKAINDHYGHASGDRVIVDFARQCRAVLRASDQIGRLGGEEFAALLPSSGHAEALIVAERLRGAVEAAIVEAGEKTIAYRVSIGIATLHPQETLDMLLNRADKQLYLAKQQGRNRICSGEEA
ncbi:GGDEF domain-containing protein [Paludibacterium yongneupense]|uniref:GGDEF domain-containing protein n=1 Tax=Paludibacterium yongneupense TaxID=400061 RepID=UPI000417CA68|nr:diguanylate cyclase [Paludibacterium yongneupense]